ncbi:hypothetical protein JCM5350_007403 [Sporobolomyces pararoseus]
MSFSTLPGYRPNNFWQRIERHDDDDQRVGVEFSRRLGTLEQRFDIASTKGGQSDTFILLRLNLEGSGQEFKKKEEFSSRLLLAWTRLRARHPLLAATIRQDDDDDHQGTIPGCPGRKFNYRVPKSSNEAIRLAQLSFLRARGDGDLEKRIEEIKSRYVLNGERVLLEEEECLARLILVENENHNHENQLGFFLVISHVISDGLSVLKLVQELFETSASPDLPSPPQPFSSSNFLGFDRFIAKDYNVEPIELSQALHEAWKMTLPESEILSSLPLSTEDHLPRLPLSSIPPNPPLQVTEVPPNPQSVSSDSLDSSSITSARKRWIWAISRTITLARQRRSPRTLPFPRLKPSSPTPPIRTKWEFVRFDKETTARLLKFCKLNGQSPSMLLYSLISIATANFYSSHHPPDPYHPILIGFPFSARPLLERRRRRQTSSTTSSDPSSDLAIRLTFTSIALPNLPLPINRTNVLAVKRAVLRGARLAKSQLSKRLAVDRLNRTIFLSGIDAINTDRLLLRYDQPRPPWEEPKTCINGSMIGDVDRILEKRFSFSGFNLRLSNLEIGTRLHTGEGSFHEGFTFDGQLQLSGGLDEELVKPEHFWSILNGVKEIGELIASVKEEEEE